MAAIDRSVVAHLAPFSSLDGSEIDALLSEARALRFAKGAHVFEQGGDAHSFYVLLHGHVQAVKTTPDGQQIVMRYISPGEVFGIATAIGVSAYPATAIAVVESVALGWPSAAWSRIAARYPSFIASTLQTVGQRLQDAQTRIIEAATEAVERRVAHALLRLAQQAGRKIERGIEIDFPISRQDIAEMTGTTLHTVSRILSAWEKRGLVASGRRRIVIRDAHQLFVVAERPGEEE
ncbi:MAG TPA: Crp/Fnr family transcriptional regulator [Xanthobacteraceae bacterium]|nr:Crp/Fnr family transcriptional regulator [Xanthobacteraceae bacterium]